MLEVNKEAEVKEKSKQDYSDDGSLQSDMICNLQDKQGVVDRLRYRVSCQFFNLLGIENNFFKSIYNGHLTCDDS